MSNDTPQELLDLVEQQERKLGALTADYARLTAANLAHEMFIRAVVAALAQRGVLRAEHMSVVVAHQISAAEKVDTNSIGRDALDHLKMLLSSALTVIPSDKPNLS